MILYGSSFILLLFFSNPPSPPTHTQELYLEPYIPPYICNVNVCLVVWVISGLDPCKDLVPPLSSACESAPTLSVGFFLHT